MSVSFLKSKFYISVAFYFIGSHFHHSCRPTLFRCSILENIRYGNPEATDQEVADAARKANAHEFITGFPRGYHEELGERGVLLSGGQKQRIAIARALLSNPRILLLDEATSALDNRSERLVQNALDILMEGRTVVVIAHRLSTIRNADIIYVMSKGGVVEAGPHEELVKRPNGIYKAYVFFSLLYWMILFYPFFNLHI